MESFLTRQLEGMAGGCNIPVMLLLFLNREKGKVVVSVDKEVNESGSKGNK